MDAVLLSFFFKLKQEIQALLPPSGSESNYTKTPVAFNSPSVQVLAQPLSQNVPSSVESLVFASVGLLFPPSA